MAASVRVRRIDFLAYPAGLGFPEPQLRQADLPQLGRAPAPEIGQVEQAVDQADPMVWFC
ncbi:hypothetical protein [Fodinicurvata fenggangensis]|uniref:hypothetical protein n=1 Tax=Fodinicurvata fenggangensis TaxID=1121830 RepID=UPI00047934D0|nr:hypothetical protein [Fodinicurvata fenggangensis]